MSDNRKIYGLGAEFKNAGELLHACEKIRDAGFQKWDAHSPFPIHGIDDAMGTGKSWLSAPVMIGGTLGFTTAILLTCIPSFSIYPMIVNGKPTDFMTMPAFFPIMFELTVLFSAFFTVFSLLIMNQLPKWYHPVFNWDRIKRATDDGFFIVIEQNDPRFNEEKTRAFLAELGGEHITLIHD